MPRVRRRLDGRGAYSNAFLLYVERQVGAGGLADVLGRSGLGPERVAEVLAGDNLRVRELVTCYDAASEACGDPDLGRRVGEELFRINHGDGMADLFLAAGSVRRAFDLVIVGTNSMTRTRQLDIVDAADDRLIIEARYAPGAEAHRLFCGLATGYYAAVPGVFGAEGSAGEPACVLRGDATCRYRLTWTRPDATVEVALASGPVVERSQRRVSGFFHFVEELLAAAAELSRAADLPALLAGVARSAGITMALSHFVVAVRLTDDGRLHHAHWGYDDPDEAARVAADLVRGRGTEVGPGGAAVDIATPTRRYGRLAAYIAGELPADVIVGVLQAYAILTSATIERLSALDSAAADRDVARALLDLAHAVDADDVIGRLSAAVARVTQCDHASVWWWDDADTSFRLVTRTDRGPVAELPHHTVVVADAARLAALVDSGLPIALPVSALRGPVREVFDALGASTLFVLPIVVRGELLGAVVAVFSRRDLATDTLLAAMAGITDQAATALDNARLIEQVHRQARQDSLTGLANRWAIEEEVRSCLAQAEPGPAPVALLFVDLDQFKAVNDTLGHHAGDELIRQVAARLEDCVRERDTVSRLGGDEFLVLCRDVVDAAIPGRVMARITEMLGRPFVVHGESVAISCSVGAAACPQDGTDYDTLLRHADAAMYRAKAASS